MVIFVDLQGLLDDPSRNSHYVSLPLLCAGPNFIPVVEVKDRPQMTEKSSSLPKPEKPLSDSLISKITQQGKETETQLRDYELIRRQQVQVL